MPYAIEMFFDSAADAEIRRIWDRFALIGSGFMRDSGARPHVSLAVYDLIDLTCARTLLDRIARDAAPLSFSLASIGAFPSPSPVAFLAPKVTADLLSFHYQIFSTFSEAGFDCWHHYAPAHWIPHCTVAMDAELSQLSRLCDICQTETFPISGTFTEIGIVEFRPTRQLYSAPFAGCSSPGCG